MTPFELNLGHDLDIERQRFDNEWLFKWYNTNIEGRIVDVPSFDGGGLPGTACFRVRRSRSTGRLSDGT
jgi:hypothetical protein